MYCAFIAATQARIATALLVIKSRDRGFSDLSTTPHVVPARNDNIIDPYMINIKLALIFIEKKEILNILRKVDIRKGKSPIKVRFVIVCLFFVIFYFAQELFAIFGN